MSIVAIEAFVDGACYAQAMVLLLLSSLILSPVQALAPGGEGDPKSTTPENHLPLLPDVLFTNAYPGSALGSRRLAFRELQARGRFQDNRVTTAFYTGDPSELETIIKDGFPWQSGFRGVGTGFSLFRSPLPTGRRHDQILRFTLSKHARILQAGSPLIRALQELLRQDYHFRQEFLARIKKDQGETHMTEDPAVFARFLGAQILLNPEPHNVGTRALEAVVVLDRSIVTKMEFLTGPMTCDDEFK